MMDIHEANEITTFKHIIGDTFIDVGANQGRWTIALAENFKTIWAFEPNVHAYRILWDNVNNYGIDHGKTNQPVHLINGALSSYTGRGELTCYESTTWSTLLARNPGMEKGRKAVEKMTVDVYALDDISELKSSRIDLVKIDTEGAEIPVIRGGWRLLARDKPSLHIEVHRPQDEAIIRDLLPWATFEKKMLDANRCFLVYRKS